MSNAVNTKILKWERLAHDPAGDIKTEWQDTYRAAVPGGWLIAIWATVERDHTGDPKGRPATASETTIGAGKRITDGYWGGGVTFVPDPEHCWQPATYSDQQKAANATADTEKPDTK